jgi:hypothetical protein
MARPGFTPEPPLRRTASEKIVRLSRDKQGLEMGLPGVRILICPSGILSFLSEEGN